jgi:hypothetical protein
MHIKKLSIGGLKPTPLTPVPGVVSPLSSNTASPNKVGSQAVVKTPKAKKPGQATDKASVFYGSLGKAENKVNSINKLQSFLESHRAKKKG